VDFLLDGKNQQGQFYDLPSTKNKKYWITSMRVFHDLLKTEEKFPLIQS